MAAEDETIQQDLSDKALDAVAGAFVAARRSASGLDTYPGAVPPDLDTAYKIQELAIDRWDDRIGGWKVGRIPPALEGDFGCDRLAGPIFGRSIVHADGGADVEMPVFAKGFAAVEAEFLAVISRDAPAEQREWTRAEAAAMIGALRVGLEVASSPLGAINDLGPAVTASDFGNNAGLIVGPEIPGWANRDPATLTSTTSVDDRTVGEGGAFLLTGGVVRSVQFLLELAARRGRRVSAGDIIATGQTTGIHVVAPGQLARVEFGGGSDGALSCRIRAAQPG